MRGHIFVTFHKPEVLPVPVSAGKSGKGSHETGVLDCNL